MSSRSRGSSIRGRTRGRRSRREGSSTTRFCVGRAAPDTRRAAEGRKGEEPDYAILRLARSAGDEAVGGWPAGATPPKRGFMKLKTTGEAFAPDSPLVIVQHPSGDPLSIAFDTDSVIRLNDGKTRVRYRTNTEHGSSGSPCFNLKLELVALHHAGDPEYDHPPEYNAGIPIDVIVALLAQRNINI